MERTGLLEYPDLASLLPASLSFALLPSSFHVGHISPWGSLLCAQTKTGCCYFPVLAPPFKSATHQVRRMGGGLVPTATQAQSSLNETFPGVTASPTAVL